MSALPSFIFAKPAIEEARPPEPQGDRWLSLRHAACELDVSTSTVRRWLQTGKLRSRLVTRGRRKYYYVLMPETPARANPGRVSNIVDHMRKQLDQRNEELALRGQYLQRQEDQIANLSRSLSRAIGQNGATAGNGDSPYEKYRSIVRRRRFWIIG